MISLNPTINYLGAAMPQSAPTTNTIVKNSPGQDTSDRESHVINVDWKSAGEQVHLRSRR